MNVENCFLADFWFRFEIIPSSTTRTIVQVQFQEIVPQSIKWIVAPSRMHKNNVLMYSRPDFIRSYQLGDGSSPEQPMEFVLYPAMFLSPIPSDLNSISGFSASVSSADDIIFSNNGHTHGCDNLYDHLYPRQQQHQLQQQTCRHDLKVQGLESKLETTAKAIQPTLGDTAGLVDCRLFGCDDLNGSATPMATMRNGELMVVDFDFLDFDFDSNADTAAVSSSSPLSPSTETIVSRRMSLPAAMHYAVMSESKEIAAAVATDGTDASTPTEESNQPPRGKPKTTRRRRCNSANASTPAVANTPGDSDSPSASPTPTKASGPTTPSADSRVRAHECSICFNRFLRRQDLSRHEATHSRTRIYVCPRKCGSSFARSDALTRHVLRSKTCTD
ncbi:hypothetical protein HDU84_002594 [Entophlyctis sp. JEL0112]|nr:hypothetical protein HDU84_002594 [Entophlyctis sp. JEL0112]